MTSIHSGYGPLELDRHHLHSVHRAFLALNEARLELARDSLSESQRLFIDVLPVLLHYNHPMLPGYLSRNTPAGIDGFNPVDQHLLQLRKLTRSFQSNRKSDQQADILSLFSMGSFGTIAHNQHSDIDIWLCYRPDLSADDLQRLEVKCRKISDWAKTLQLDVTLFLMSHEAFRSSQQLVFSQEASGTTQHYLLLDEFYRTAIHLAGQLPAWLYISPEQEAVYTDCSATLVRQRLLPEKRLIDFGPINEVPASEFISSAIWQLYKAIKSPYKAIMKLLVLEIYCRQYPQVNLLSGAFKAQLHGIDRERKVHLWDTDPYLQTYAAIESYLQETGQQARLDFLRRCFYFKLEQPLTGHYRASRKSAKLLEMTREWGWDENYIRYLDNHNRWRLQDVLDERRAIVTELNHSYHMIMDFFRAQKSQMQASNRELNILGRKLHAAFSKKAGKIDSVNPLHSHNVAEPILIIRKQPHSGLWRVTDKQNKTIINKTTPVELITWLHCNQVMISASRLYFDKPGKELPLLQSLRRYVTSLLPLPITVDEHGVFQQACQVKKLFFFIDYQPDKDPLLVDDQQGLQLASVDCSVDFISVNSWSEVICDSRQGPLFETLLLAFVELYQREKSSFKPDVLINHPNRLVQQVLRETIGKLFDNITDFFRRYPAGRYITYINHRYLTIHLNEKRSSVRWLTTERELKTLLSSPVAHFSPVGFDSNTMAYHPLALYTQRKQANVIQVFFRPRGHEADVTVIDELGTWHETTISYSSGRSSLQPIHRFLRAVNDRRRDQQASEIGPLDILPINFYEIVHTEDGWQPEPCLVSSQIHYSPLISFYATAEYRDDDYQFTLHCNEHVFSESADGVAAYTRFAAFIESEKKRLQQHRGKKNQTVMMPPVVAMVDLDLSRCSSHLVESGDLQTVHYLNVKTLLEQKIGQIYS